MDKQQQYELEIENYFLKMKDKIHGALYSGQLDSILRPIAEEHIRVKYEREMYAAKILQFIEQLVYVSDDAQHQLQKSKINISNLSDEITRIKETIGLTFMPSLWLYIHNEMEKPTYEEYKVEQTLPDARNEAILINALPELYKIVGRVKLSTFWDLSTRIFALVIGFSNEPKTICYQIMRELHFLGEARIETVSRLSSEWMRETLLRSVTHETLHNGINHAYKFGNQTHLTQGQYVANHEAVKGESNLRHYISYLKTIESESKNVPDQIKQAIDAIWSK